MNPKGLRAFVEIMTCGTLTLAARNLNASESSISRQIQQLETTLGLTLFLRENRRLIPTPEAEAFFSEAQRLLDVLGQVPAIVDEIKHATRRSLRLVVMPRLSASIAGPAVKRFMDENPDVHVSLNLQPRVYLERWVAGYRFDIGLGALPTHHEALETAFLCSAPVVAVMRPDHPLAGREAVTARDLAAHRLIALGPKTLVGGKMRAIFENAGLAMQPTLDTTLTETACTLASVGCGITLCDAFAPQFLRDAVTLVPVTPAETLDFGLLYPRGVTPSALTKRLEALIRAEAEAMTKRLAAG